MIDIRLLKKLYKKINVNDFNISFDTIDNNKNFVMNEISSVRFCPDNIKEYLNGCNKNCCITSKYGIKFHVFYDNKTVPIIYTLLKAYKQAIIIKQYFNLKKNLDIFIIMSPFKRYISYNEIINAKHINGGFTNSNDNKIFIIRSEEFAKVILHEILHHISDVDKNMEWSNKHVDILHSVCNISKKTKLFPNEAIVELWATVFYSIFLSLHYNINLNKILDIEINYSIRQHNKIIKYQDNKQWIEYTNAYCYIVFKTILLYNLNKYKKDFNIDDIVKFLIKYKNTIPQYNNDKYNKVFDKTRINNSLRVLYLSDY